MRELATTCCIIGGGPAGMMLGFLLARAGVDVTVLEKHADFLRDFRGDTVHPSTLQVMDEVGLLEEFLKRPHQEIDHLSGIIGGRRVVVADFSHLPTRCRFIAVMPQWDFLDFLVRHGAAYPNFHLHMRHEGSDLLEDKGRVVGVRATTPDGPLQVRAALVVAADGRHSRMRGQAGLAVEDLGAPIDVLWMRLPKRPHDRFETLGHIEAGHIFVMIDRGDYWQCAFVIPKGGIEELKSRGLDAFRADIAAIEPDLVDRGAQIESWDDVKLLTVKVDRLRSWFRGGLLCIGDAAHAMSPIGGVGINLAIQDAVAAANLLAEPLRRGAVETDLLAAVQRRRMLPTRVIQGIQLFIQNNVMTAVLAAKETPRPPFAVQLLDWIPRLRRIPARLVGLGIRPEHVRTTAASAARPPRQRREAATH